MTDRQDMRSMEGSSAGDPGRSRRNTLGILSICFFWIPLVGIVLGIISLSVRERNAALGIVGIVLSILAPVLAVSVLGVGCASCAVKGADEAGKFIEEATCQSHMRAIASAESVFSGKYGRYGTLPELISAGLLDAGDGLSCPSCGADAILDADDSGYTVTCPCGAHGSVADGVMSWL